jgi:hypothetical protein
MDNTDRKSRRYCFTIPNYTKKNLKELKSLAESLSDHRYICYGLELSKETGLPHIQGYIEFNIAQRFLHLQSYFNLTKRGKPLKFHIEEAKGSAEQNKKYCEKEGDFYEFGEPSTQGKRTDMIKMKERVKNNPRDIDKIIDEDANNFQQLKFVQAIQPIYLEHRNPNVPPTVYWIFGPTGIGKTSLIYRNFEDICSVSSPRWAGTGYNQNECLLFDDYRPADLPFNDLLKIADRYPYTLERKHGNIPLNSPFIVFTSPKPVREAFKFLGEDVAQLERRVIQIHLLHEVEADNIDLQNLDSKYIHEGVNDYKKNWGA